MRRRSFWAWGYADRLPTPDDQRKLAGRVGPLLGAGATPRDLPPLDVGDLCDPVVTPPSSLAAIASVDPHSRATHTRGRGYPDLVRGLAGDFTAAPDCVMSPRHDDDLDAVYEWAARERLAVIPFGGGTSVVGGVDAARPPGYRGVISLDLGAMSAVLEVDDVSQLARIQAGILGPDLENALATHGLTLRHFPQSFEMSTLGGWLATRAGGHFATGFTHIDDLTQAVRMWTSGGVWQSRPVPASGAGPCPTRWVLGSEGTLGVITEAWMKLRARPTQRASATVRFAKYEAAVRAAQMVVQSGLTPANCRLLDTTEAMIHRVVSDGSNVLLLAFESAGAPVDGQLTAAVEMAKKHGGVVGAQGGDSGEEGEDSTWRKAFIDAPYQMNTLVSLGVLFETFETACTWTQFPELHQKVKQAASTAATEVCGRALVSSRLTHIYSDGPAPYYTVIAPARAGGELEQWKHIKSAVSHAIADAGGTITHHHAVGRVHRPWYDRERPEPFARALAAVKNELDPAGVLNPGVLIDGRAGDGASP